jgi:hypothetical protein
LRPRRLRRNLHQERRSEEEGKVDSQAMERLDLAYCGVMRDLRSVE